jgi:uncharacterized protein (TIGR02145 family)
MILMTSKRSISGYSKIIMMMLFVIAGCAKDNVDETPIGYVSDTDGNQYRTVSIGSQVWMAENLRVLHFRNGDPVKYIENVIYSGSQHGSPSCCDFNDHPENAVRYGKFYNEFAVTDDRILAPEGWHIPSKEEWTILINYLGGQLVAGGKLKDTCLLWLQPNVGATNESGFSAKPGGYRDIWHDVAYYNYAYLWSSTRYDVTDLYCVYLSRSTTYAGFSHLYPECCLPVRCIKD